jgi:hypothetical protein
VEKNSISLIAKIIYLSYDSLDIYAGEGLLSSFFAAFIEGLKRYS